MSRTQASERSWWADLIGAHERPDSHWRLGTPEFRPDGTSVTTVQLTTFDSAQDATLLLPASDGASVAVIVVPFYDVESLLGLPSDRYPEAQPSRAFAVEIARAGLGVLAVPWWAEIETRPRSAVDLHDRYDPIATAHREQFPAVTGLGRSITDLRLALDALGTIEQVDAGRIGVFGHSLGGKFAMFLAALDTRVSAAVIHEPGLGFAHSNWEDPWYFGERVPSDHDLDDVLALIAPRPVLYVGGGASDGAHNADLAARAATAWPAAASDTAPSRSCLEIMQHESGHPIPAEVLERCIRWLGDHLAYSGGR